MNETIKQYDYPDKIYGVFFESIFKELVRNLLECKIIEVQKAEESDDCCYYKYQNEEFEVELEDIIEYAKEFAEEDGEEFDENGINFSLTYEGAKQIAINNLKQQVAKLRDEIVVIKNKITSLEKS